MVTQLLPDPPQPEWPRVCAVCRSTDRVILVAIEPGRYVPLCEHHRELAHTKKQTPKKRRPIYPSGF